MQENSTCAFFAQVADNNKTYKYFLHAIIAVGYRINSSRATQFCIWATRVLGTFAKHGYLLNKDRLINGQISDEDFFGRLISKI